MKKLLKLVAKRNIHKKNFRFINKKYASTYLQQFVFEFNTRKQLFCDKNKLVRGALEELTSLFALNIYKRQEWMKLACFLSRQSRTKVCPLTGRARGFLAKFHLARTMFRRVAKIGGIVGVRKSSF